MGKRDFFGRHRVIATSTAIITAIVADLERYGAHRSFDIIGPARDIAERINPELSTERGAAPGGHPRAGPSLLFR